MSSARNPCPPAAALQPGFCQVGSRTVFWTGRVAIGLRYQTPQHQPVGPGMQRLQSALLGAA
ncbi:MAG: hypothetical protein V4792_16420 [Pseudomonadota bacterium]